MQLTSTRHSLERTIAEMQRLVRTYRDEVKDLRFPTVRALHEYVKRVPYVRDLDAPECAGHVECVKRPSITIHRGGDCDDKTVLAGSLLLNHGYPVRFVTVSFHPEGEMEHVYLELKRTGAWLPFDATSIHSELYREKLYTAKQVYPMILQDEGSRLAVLESDAVGQLGPLPIVALPVIGKLPLKDLVGKMLGPLNLVGKLIRGKTPHASWDQALNVGGSAAAAAMPEVRRYPPKIIPDLANGFAESAASFIKSSGWWRGQNSHIADDIVKHQSEGPDPYDLIHGTVVRLATWVAKNVDSFRFEADFSTHYETAMDQTFNLALTDITGRRVEPLPGGGVPPIRDGGPGGILPTVQTSGLAMWVGAGMITLAGGGFVAMAVSSRRRRRGRRRR